MAAKRVTKSRSMSLKSAKALALAFNGTRFLISGDRTDKRSWNASRDSVRGSIPECYAGVFDELCPAFGQAASAKPWHGAGMAAPVRESEADRDVTRRATWAETAAAIPARAPVQAEAITPERIDPNRYGTAAERGAWSFVNGIKRTENPHGTGAGRCSREWFRGFDVAREREYAAL